MDSERFFDALADVPNVRSATFSDLEMKDGGNVYLFDGYSTPYNDVTDLGDFTEEVRAGAFDQVVTSGQNVPFLHEHHPHELLATTQSGRLKLDSDSRGLRVRAKIVKTDLSSRIKALVDSGDIRGMSSGWVVGRGNHKVEMRAGASKPHRTILNFKKLLDVSTTWNPAYVSTEAQFRSRALQYTDSPESWQRILMGAYPQLVDLGNDEEGRQDDDPDEVRTAEPVLDEGAHPRVPDLETAKRRMSFLLLTTGGYDDAS